MHRILPHAYHGGPSGGVITFRRISQSLGLTIRETHHAFTQALEALGEYRAAATYTDELPEQLWFPRCVSIECRPDQQIFMGMR
jgi:hypothetical protein